MPKKDTKRAPDGEFVAPVELALEPTIELEPASAPIPPEVTAWPTEITALANRGAFFSVHLEGQARPLEVVAPEWLSVAGAPAELDGRAELTLGAVYGHDAPQEGELTVGNAVVRVFLRNP